MKKILYFITLLCISKTSFGQVEIKDSVFIKINNLESKYVLYQISNGKMIGVDILIKNKYENQTGYASGYFGSNLILKEKHKLDPKKILSYVEYVNLINKNLMDVYLHYKIYFILSEAKYAYLILQVRQMVQYQE